MRNTKEMAREVKMPYDFITGEPINLEKLEAFASLVRAEALAEPPAQRKPLTDGEIQEAVTKAVRERQLSWLGFKEDDQGEYTIPVLSLSDYQMARAIEAKLKEKNGL